jgi:AcrR family transcriptional regulator
MQVLKDEIKNRILEAALNEFLDMGYQSASMRKIARNAHIAIGNIYHYYKNKQELFNALVGSVYDKLMCALREICKIDARAVPDFNFSAGGAIGNYYGTQLIVEKLMDICREDNKQLLILLEKSKGVNNAYENAKKDLIDALNDVLLTTMTPNLEAIGKGGDHRIMMGVLAAAFIEGFCVILRENRDGDTVKTLADEMIRIFFKDILDRF